MSRPVPTEMFFIPLYVEGFFYGLYSGIFAVYLRHQVSRQDINKTQNIVFYSMCTLYGLSVAVFVCDAVVSICQLHNKPMDSLFPVVLIQAIGFGFCDFIAQIILIYRCWIVWNRNIRVVIIPLILACAFLGTWLACSGSLYILSDRLVGPAWEYSAISTGLALSLTVNTLVMGLIVFRIFKVFREVKTTSYDKILGTTSGGTLRRTIFILIESGMALFSIQLARLVISLTLTNTVYNVPNTVVGIHEMLNGIAPTIILVRTSMGLSFHDEKSMEELAIESLQFSLEHVDSMSETGHASIMHRDNRDEPDDDTGVQRSNDTVLMSPADCELVYAPFEVPPVLGIRR